MRLIILGPPGAGKGTQAKIIVKKNSIPQLSTGDILRAAIASGSEIGQKAKAVITAGKLVPDDLAISIVSDRIDMSDCARGFILDGFPRTLAQADALDGMLCQKGVKLDCVLELRVADDDELIKRVSGRFACSNCGEGYHDAYKTPVIEERCDRCGGKEFGRRPDDNAQTMSARLQAYYKETSPLIGYYYARKVLRSVNGMGNVDEIAGEIQNVLFKVMSG